LIDPLESRQSTINQGPTNPNTQGSGNADMFSGLGVKAKTTGGPVKKLNPFEMGGSGNQQPSLSFQTNAPSMSQNQFERDINMNSYNPEFQPQQTGFGNMGQQQPTTDEQPPQPKKGPSFGKFKKETTPSVPNYTADTEDTSHKAFTESTEAPINFDARSEPSEHNHEVPVFKKVNFTP
jgi:hypothetical protein